MSNIGLKCYLDQGLSISLVRFSICVTLSEIGEFTITKVAPSMLIDVMLTKTCIIIPTKVIRAPKRVN